MTLPFRTAGFLALSLALGPAVRADTALAATSPFLPADGSATAGAEATPLELRGILRDAGGYRFSIYDPVSHSSVWVRLNEPGHDFTVRVHDAARDIVTLDYQGRTLTLPLHSAKVVGLAVPEPAVFVGPNPGTIAVRGGRMGPTPKPSTPEEAARFNRAIEEINRRRALRERGPVPPPK